MNKKFDNLESRLKNVLILQNIFLLLAMSIVKYLSVFVLKNPAGKQ
jgi:hypothetical protein